MPKYEIEQLEVYVRKYTVEAEDETEAIIKLFDGEALPVENSLELADVCDDRGLPVDEYPQLAEELCEASIMSADQTVIPSIRSIRQVEACP